MLEEAQGADVQGRSIMVDYVGDKSQKGGMNAGKLTGHFYYVCMQLIAVCL